MLREMLRGSWLGVDGLEMGRICWSCIILFLWFAAGLS